MVNTKTSRRLAQPQFTLALVLVIFVCQIFINNRFVSVQYPAGEHSFGVTVKHHHSHEQHDNHEHDTEFSSVEIVDSDDFSDQANTSIEHSEHEHANHGHNAWHPPVDLVFAPTLCLTDANAGSQIPYQTCCYAPPIPPPNA